MKKLLEKIMNRRIWALFIKEMRQIKHDKRLIMSMTVMPTVQLLFFGFALNPSVTDLRLGVLDESRSEAGRELVSAFVESRSFQVAAYFDSPETLGESLSRGELDAGLIIPPDFARDRARGVTADVQLLFDAVDSNAAGIARGYAGRILDDFNKRNVAQNIEQPGGRVTPRVALLYNPGLQSAWFIMTGTLGLLLVLNGSLVAAASMVKEKEVGTVEQLLMTPAGASEIITAKMGPLFVLLIADIALALALGRVVFGVPVRGDLLTLYLAGALCVIAGIGIGTFIATFSRSQQQAQLMSFFVNPPLSMLSGATTPVEAMPEWLQPLLVFNPIAHFAKIARGLMLKGAGIEVLYPNLLALAVMALLLVGISAWRFRKQLG